MKLPRRQFLHLAAGAVGLLPVSRFAWAQAYPTRPVRMIVPFPAGGSTDVVARLMGQWLSVRLVQPFLVENRTGFTGNIGTEAVVHAPADGYTLLLTTTTNVVNAAVYDKLNFNFTRDIVPVAGVMNTSHVWWCIHQFQPGQFPSLSPMPGPTQPRLVWRRPAMAAKTMSPVRCSRCGPASIWCTYPIAAVLLRLPIWLADR